MGKLLILTNYIFLIYGSDIYESRKHVHVTYAHQGFKRSCKFWLEPSIFLASNRGVKPHDLRQIERLIFENQQILRKAYYDRHTR